MLIRHTSELSGVFFVCEIVFLTNPTERKLHSPNHKKKSFFSSRSICERMTSLKKKTNKLQLLDFRSLPMKKGNCNSTNNDWK